MCSKIKEKLIRESYFDLLIKEFHLQLIIIN